MCTEITDAFVRAHLPARPVDANKGTFGHVLCVCGQEGMTGAAYFAAAAALRCGAGLVTAALPRPVAPILAARLPEALWLPLPETNGHLSAAAAGVLAPKLSAYQAIVCGCGCGTSEAMREVLALLLHAPCPVIVDADGINLLAAHISLLETDHAPLILTPHPGEMARLCGCTVAAVQADRERYAAEFAARCGVTLVLKGYRTVVADPAGHRWVNPTGNPGMAIGGTGDLLAGVIASLVAQGLSPADAAVCGVYLHGLAGDKAAETVGPVGLLPSDMLAELPRLFI